METQTHTISQKKLQEYRAKTYHLTPEYKIRTFEDALDFVKERGFVYFWPIKGIALPSLWAAVAGQRPVADAHDDPGHITWSWKDEALGKRFWYYGKILRKKATMIDLDVAPYFYALSENYGNPEEDVRIAYQEGRLSLEAKTIFEALSDNGPLDTISIRRATRMTNKESNSRFDRALSALQADFKILPVGISDAGGWRYAFIYDLTNRHYPDLLKQARSIKEKEARQVLAKLFFRSVGLAHLSDLNKLFHWPPKATERAVKSLVEAGFLTDNIHLRDNSDPWIGLKDLLED